MEILTDRRHGDEALAPYLPDLDGEWEFIVRGEAAQSFYHQWVCQFHLVKSTRKRLYALRIDDWGDPDDPGDEDGFPEIESKIVAVWPDPPIHDENEIVRQLLATYEAHGGKYIDYYEYDDVGEFDIAPRRRRRCGFFPDFTRVAAEFARERGCSEADIAAALEKGKGDAERQRAGKSGHTKAPTPRGKRGKKLYLIDPRHVTDEQLEEVVRQLKADAAADAQERKEGVNHE